MRRLMIPIGACALIGTMMIAPAATAADPVSNQLPKDARKISKWDRMWFRSAGPVGGTDYVQPFSPPTSEEVRKTAPAANSIGVINIGWFVGNFPALPAIPPFIPEPQPAIPDVDVPADMAQAGIKTYVWYNTLTGGDDPDGAPDFLGLIPIPGWNDVADTDPPADWIATDHTGEYKSWAQGRGNAPVMVAHRGGGTPGEDPSATPENSMAAFRQAVANDAGVLETDVQWTKPDPGAEIGTPVLMHDLTIDRTTSCKQTVPDCVPPNDTKVADLTLQQLREYQLANGENIPTLAQFLHLANKDRVGVLPEIKNWKTHADGMIPELEQYTDMLLAKRKIPSIIIGSFDPTILQYFEDQATLVHQKAKCAKLPKRLKADTKKVLLKKTCRTNAGKKVKVKLKARKSVAKLVKGDHGRVSVKVKDRDGWVRIKYWAKDTPGYDRFNKRKSYRVRGASDPCWTSSCAPR